MTLLLNQQPRPARGVVALEHPETVWVGCIWDHGEDRVKEVVPARATHRAPGLVLCDFYDPRSGPSREHWMEEEFVRERIVPATEHAPRRHPAAAPSPQPHDDVPRPTA
jgi:hypothetical protein